jgi:large subunit ribosomal protein L28
MAKCEICSKNMLTGKKFSYRGSQVTKRFKTTQHANVKSIRIHDGGSVRKAAICTRCLRSNIVQRAV